MKLCDCCGAKLVNDGKIKPLCEIYIGNQIPWEHCNCEKCGSLENCMDHPDHLIKKDEK